MLPQYLDDPRYLGWKVADMHVHTWHSRDVLHLEPFSPESLYRKGRNKGLDFIIFTDHDSVDAYDAIGWEREGLVTGCEVSVLDRERVGHTIHINVYELDRQQFHELEEIAQKAGNVGLFTQYCREQGLHFTYNHPFYSLTYEKASIDAILEIAHLFPVIEVNMHRIGPKNAYARLLAKRFDKGISAGTDTHFGEIGKAYTIAPGESFSDYFDNISKGNSEISCTDLTTLAIFREIQRFVRITRRAGVSERRLARELVERGIFEENPQMVQDFMEFITDPEKPKWMFNNLFYSESVQLAISGLYVLLEKKQTKRLVPAVRRKELEVAATTESYTL